MRSPSQPPDAELTAPPQAQLREPAVATIAERTAADALRWWRAQHPEALEVTWMRSLVLELRPYFDVLERDLERFRAQRDDTTFMTLWKSTVRALQVTDEKQRELARKKSAAPPRPPAHGGRRDEN